MRRSAVSSASRIGARYLMPWRKPCASASAPMFAAIQKWPSGALGAAAAGVPARLDAALEDALLLVGRGRTVGAEPVAQPGQLPRRLEVAGVGGEAIGPDLLGGQRARALFAIAIEHVGIALRPPARPTAS